MWDLFLAAKSGKTGTLAVTRAASTDAFQVLPYLTGPVLLEFQCSQPMHFTHGNAAVRAATVNEFRLPPWFPWPVRIDSPDDNFIRAIVAADGATTGYLYITNISDVVLQPRSA